MAISLCRTRLRFMTFFLQFRKCYYRNGSEIARLCTSMWWYCHVHKNIVLMARHHFSRSKQNLFCYFLCNVNKMDSSRTFAFFATKQSNTVIIAEEYGGKFEEKWDTYCFYTSVWDFNKYKGTMLSNVLNWAESTTHALSIESIKPKNLIKKHARAGVVYNFVNDRQFPCYHPISIQFLMLTMQHHANYTELSFQFHKNHAFHFFVQKTQYEVSVLTAFFEATVMTCFRTVWLCAWAGDENMSREITVTMCCDQACREELWKGGRKSSCVSLLGNWSN